MKRHMAHLRRVRARLRHAALTQAPLWLTRGRLARAYHKQVPVIRQHDIYLPQLPPGLEGFRITHVSDLHVGRLVKRSHLRLMVQMVRQTQGDLIALTGDFVDLSLSVLDDVLIALGELSAPLGVHLVAGNHDYLVDREQLVRRFAEANFPLLINRCVHLTYRDCGLVVAGIDWARRASELESSVRRTVQAMRRCRQLGLTLLLSHHPGAFESARRLGVDLTLAGHTHGGQVVMPHPMKRGRDLHLGHLAGRYVHGLYQQRDRYLHVTSGYGAWFPLRVRCPPEIAVLTLHCGKKAGAKQP